MTMRMSKLKSIRTKKIYNNDTIFHGSVYSLELKENKFYVGYTLHPKTRLRQHFSGEGAKWTRQYEPVAITNFFPGDITVEEIVTLILMRDHGIDRVRGALWCHTDYDIPNQQISVIKNKIDKIKDISVKDVKKDYSLCNRIT